MPDLLRFGPRLGGGSRRVTTAQRGDGSSVPARLVKSWPATVLLCVATALVTWSVTTLALSGDITARPGTVVAYAPPVPAEQSAAQLATGRVPGSASLKTVKAPGSTQTNSQGSVVTAPATTERLRAVHLSIPAIGVDQNLVELAVNGDALQVPDRYSDIGWWRDGPVPGRHGAAVVVGHVDSPTGPAVFYQLSGMVRGQSIVVTLSDRSREVFKVRQAVLYDRSVIPSQRVYRQKGRPGLNLLTCGGNFDHAADAYNGNVVVYTDLVKRLPSPAEVKAAHHRAAKKSKVTRTAASRRAKASRTATAPHGTGAQQKSPAGGHLEPGHVKVRSVDGQTPWTRRQILGLDPHGR